MWSGSEVIFYTMWSGSEVSFYAIWLGFKGQDSDHVFSGSEVSFLYRVVGGQRSMSDHVVGVIGQISIWENVYNTHCFFLLFLQMSWRG